MFSSPALRAVKRKLKALEKQHARLLAELETLAPGGMWAVSASGSSPEEIRRKAERVAEDNAQVAQLHVAIAAAREEVAKLETPREDKSKGWSLKRFDEGLDRLGSGMRRFAVGY